MATPPPSPRRTKAGDVSQGLGAVPSAGARGLEGRLEGACVLQEGDPQGTRVGKRDKKKTGIPVPLLPPRFRPFPAASHGAAAPGGQIVPPCMYV